MTITEYLALEKGEEIQSKEIIERIDKKCRAYRNMLDIEPGFDEKRLAI